MRLDSQRFLHLFNLFDRFGDFVQTDVEMQLLLFQIRTLFVVQFDEVVDEVQIVARCYGRTVTSTTSQTSRRMMERLMHVNGGVDDSLAMAGWHVKSRERGREMIR